MKKADPIYIETASFQMNTFIVKLNCINFFKNYLKATYGFNT